MASIDGRRDAGGYAPIGDYGIIGDGRSVALVGLDGTVDWWPVGGLDSPPVFAALLDPQHGGWCRLRPVEPDAVSSHRYLPDTNLLETMFTNPSGSVSVLDSLNRGHAGPLPWAELARRVEGLEGSVEMELVVSAGTGLGQWQPWVEDDPRGPILHAGDTTIGVRVPASAVVQVRERSVVARVQVAAGERATFGLVASDGAPLYLAGVESIDARIDLSAGAWRAWAAQVEWPGAGRERIVRSALALNLLQMVETGAIAAAATTSLPEQVGGPKNWDYRFCWVRDAALTVDAMALCGLQEEVHAAVSWLLDTIRRQGPDIHVMYTLGGEVSDGTTHAPVPGYRDSRPVQVGNDATSQTQLGIYGDLFGTVSDWVSRGHMLDVRSARELADLADRCADVWMHDDAGIWELQQVRPYTSSKMNCWRALDAASRLADAGHLAGPGDRWAAEARRIRTWVREHCWSDRLSSYTFYAGTEDLDASVVLGARFGFDRGPDMASTVDAVISELGDGGPLVYRYSGVHREEATFVACAYWVVSALTLTGKYSQARRRFVELDAVTNPLGLMSEMSTSGSFELMGNLPQALSHLAQIQAAAHLRDAQP